ncbi:MAG TPA: glycosyltransferase 87 family protein [Micromonospora sp.]|nr:glycosyltransferase 87 family protein [Micromonospora sp.]
MAAVVAISLAVGDLYRLSTPHDFFDLKIYMKAMRWWADGNPLYDYVQPDAVQGELYFTYPPITALLLRPFAGLPLGTTIVIFTLLTVLAVAVTTGWLLTQTRLAASLARIPAVRWITPAWPTRRSATAAGSGPRREVSTWFLIGVAVPLAFAAESIRETLTFGQINMLLVTLILWDLLFAVPARSRWAGIGVGVATALKLYPGIFIIYLLVARRWRAAAAASATAAAATLLAAAVAPSDSWRFWTHELWATARVGRTDYTGNQSLLGLLSRLSAPEEPDRLLWLALVVAVAVYGLWRAAQAARAGDELAGLTLSGLVGALVSPITWPHHVYWFIPAMVVLVDAATRPAGAGPTGMGRRPRLPVGSRRAALLAFAAVGYAAVVYGVVSFYDWGIALVPTDSPVEFVLRNLSVLLALLLLAALPIRRPEPAVTGSGATLRRRPGAPAGSG